MIFVEQAILGSNEDGGDRRQKAQLQSQIAWPWFQQAMAFARTLPLLCLQCCSTLLSNRLSLPLRPDAPPSFFALLVNIFSLYIYISISISISLSLSLYLPLSSLSLSLSSLSWLSHLSYRSLISHISYIYMCCKVSNWATFGPF